MAHGFAFWFFFAMLCLYVALDWIGGLAQWILRHPERFHVTGTPRDGGSDKPFASTGTKEHGTQTPGTGTTVDSNSYSLLGLVSAVSPDLTLQRRENSSTVPGTFTFVTGGRGVSGEPLGSAD